MSKFIEISPNELQENPFNLIGKEWTLISAGNKNSYNTMTASWGGVGVLWNKNVATIYVRPQRYTYEFIENNEYFTLSFFGTDKREALTFCGTKSGRDYDKARECSLSIIDAGESIAFNEARLILVCKKLYHSDINPENFYDKDINNNYQNDYHRMYIGEIVKAMIAE